MITDTQAIITNGTNIGLGWYLYGDTYYYVYDNIIKYTTKELNIDPVIGYFTLPVKGRIGTVYFIKGFEKYIHGVHYKDIIVYDDGYYIRPHERGYALCHAYINDTTSESDIIFTSKEKIYRLLPEVYVGVSGGIHSIVKVKDGFVESEPFSASINEIYMKEGECYSTVADGVEFEINIKERFKI